ncbi:MAG: hypothetical protein QGH20_00990 [Candidatus Latescibacteria bacterium]|nr:hypothetical protein [Candidatus Latescibacterota bacterium]
MRTHHRIEPVVLVLTGASGLVLEVVWLRIAWRLLGHTATVTALVLAAMTAGIGCGALLASRWTVPRRPQVWASVVVSGVALISTAVPTILIAVGSSYAGLMTIFFPAVGMGVVFSMMTATIKQTPSIAVAYAANLVGSVGGSLAAGFVLVETFGLSRTNNIGAAVYGVAAVLALFNTKSSSGVSPTQVSYLQPEPGAGYSAWVAGVAALGLQIVWFRWLAVTLGGTVYASAVLFAWVMIAQSLGVWISGRVRRIWIPLVVAALWAPFGRALSSPIIQAVGGHSPIFATAVSLVAVGGSFTALGSVFGVLTRQLSVSRIYGYHTLGGSAGTLVVAFILLPYLGSSWSGVVITLLLFSALVYRHASRKFILFTSICAVIATLAWWHSPIRGGGAPITSIWSDEGSAGLVAVEENPYTGVRQLTTDRLLIEGSDGPLAIRAQWAQGYIARWLHGDPRRILAVGLGTAVSLSGLLGEGVDTLIAVEISDAVLEGTAYFSWSNSEVLDDSRVGVLKKDGVLAIGELDLQFDLIWADLFHPQTKGTGDLYSREQFQAYHDHLATGGAAWQWLSLEQLTPDGLKSVVRTFATVFESVEFWRFHRYGALVGRRSNERFSVELMQRSPLSSDDQRQMTLGMWTDRLQILAGWELGVAGVRSLGADGPLNTMDRPRVEFDAARAFGRSPKENLRDNLELILGRLSAELSSFTRIDQASQRALGSYRWANVAAAAGFIALQDGDDLRALEFYRSAIESDSTHVEAGLFFTDDGLMLPRAPNTIAQILRESLELLQIGQADEANRIRRMVRLFEPSPNDTRW